MRPVSVLVSALLVPAAGLVACSSGPDTGPTVDALVAGLEEGSLAEVPLRGDRAA